MFREDYIKDGKIVDKTENEYEEDLYKDLEKSRINLICLHENLNFASRGFN